MFFIPGTFLAKDAHDIDKLRKFVQEFGDLVLFHKYSNYGKIRILSDDVR